MQEYFKNQTNVYSIKIYITNQLRKAKKLNLQNQNNNYRCIKQKNELSKSILRDLELEKKNKSKKELKKFNDFEIQEKILEIKTLGKMNNSFTNFDRKFEHQEYFDLETMENQLIQFFKGGVIDRKYIKHWQLLKKTQSYYLNEFRKFNSFLANETPNQLILGKRHKIN